GFGRCWTMLPSYSLAVLARHHGHSKRKGGQVRFTPEQTSSLERRFREHKYLSPEDRRHLAAQLKLSDRQVKTWFQNRRAKWRRANVMLSEPFGLLLGYVDGDHKVPKLSKTLLPLTYGVFPFFHFIFPLFSFLLQKSLTRGFLWSYLPLASNQSKGLLLCFQ
ncbi:hypothetical protein L9F63_005025, partial [Diploptera punctata]